jgi:hypothetical protein
VSTCLDCPNDTSGKWAKYCDDCRWRHRGKPTTFTFDATKDAYLREHYRPGTEKRCAKRIAELWGYPTWAIQGRVRRLGLAREGYRGGSRPWTAEESALVEKYAAIRHPRWIARLVNRSLTAVVVKIKRLGLSLRPDGYNALQVAEGFGECRDTVERWLKKGWLRTRNVPSPGQSYAFTEDEIRAFISEHRDAFELRKVDQMWFLDLLLPMTTEQRKGRAA